jgi:hypothetical protein
MTGRAWFFSYVSLNAIPLPTGRRHRCGAANLHTRSGALIYTLVIQQTHEATISCVCQ